MNNLEVAEQLAHDALYGLDFRIDLESIGRSTLAIAWKRQVGFPDPDGKSNPWAAISIYYHFEEAQMMIAWAMLAQVRHNYLSTVIELKEKESNVSAQELGITPPDIMQGMTKWSLSIAGQRARLVGSPGVISTSEASDIIRSRTERYSELVLAAALDNSPMPLEEFQLGLPRNNHPMVELFRYSARNLCETLNLDNEYQTLARINMETSTTIRHTASFRAVLALLQYSH